MLVKRVVCGARTHVSSRIRGLMGDLKIIHGFRPVAPCQHHLRSHLPHRLKRPRHSFTYQRPSARGRLGAQRAATRFRPCSLVDSHPAPRAAARNLLRLSRTRPRATAVFLGSSALQNTPSAQASAQASARASAATPAAQAAARAFARAPATAAASFLAATAVAFATFIS